MNWKKTPLTDFNNITLPTTPNYFLVTGTDTNKYQQPEQTFLVSLAQLKTAWEKILKQQKRLQLLKSEGNHYQYVQRSFLFRFPDIIDIEFVAQGENQTTLRIFSRSVYGHSDLGVNKKRVLNWIQELQQRLV